MRDSISRNLLVSLSVIMVLILIGCSSLSRSAPKSSALPVLTRAEAIPAGAIKMTPALDALPPRLHSTEYGEPVPLDSGVNTAGGEDSAFILPDGNTLYFFFTPMSLFRQKNNCSMVLPVSGFPRSRAGSGAPRKE
jgi:hypothetical protein